MNIVRRDASPLSMYRPASIADDPFERLVENVLGDFFTPFSLSPSFSSFGPYSLLSSRQDRNAGPSTISPRLNLVETDQAFEIEAELPGVKKEDIKVALDNQRVSIEGEAKRESAQKEGENIVYAERPIRRFARSFILPAEVNDAGAQARFENGVLMLTLPKKESAQTKTLTVQ